MSAIAQRAYRKELEGLPLGKLELMYNTTHSDHPEFCAEYIRRLRFEVINQRTTLGTLKIKVVNQSLAARKTKREMTLRIDRLKEVNHLLTLESFENVL